MWVVHALGSEPPYYNGSMADEAVTTAPFSPGAAGELPFGGAIGRYLVLGVLGRGGMGIVYEAYDPVLDRRIAVKLLREIAADDVSAGRARMHREAQALARLSHPNVITVHDVSEHAGAMYIAMELVQGTTMTAWQAKRTWREIVAGLRRGGARARVGPRGRPRPPRLQARQRARR